MPIDASRVAAPIQASHPQPTMPACAPSATRPRVRTARRARAARVSASRASRRTGLAALESLARAHGLPGVAVVSGTTRGFRHRARLAIRGRPGAPKIGLFQAGTHRVVTVPNCSVHHPAINRAASIVRRALVDARIPPYSRPRTAASHATCRSSSSADREPCRSCWWRTVPGSRPLAAGLDLIRERLGAELHSLWFNANVARTNTILGPEFVRWCGPPAVVERFGGADVHYPPGAFGQNNLDIAGSIVEHVRELVPVGSAVTEFYAGVGAIGLSLLDRVRTLRLNEVAPQSLQGLSLGIEQLASARSREARGRARSGGDGHRGALGRRRRDRRPAAQGPGPRTARGAALTGPRTSRVRELRPGIVPPRHGKAHVDGRLSR